MKKLFLSVCYTLSASLLVPAVTLAQPVQTAITTEDPRNATFNGTNAISLPAHDSLNLTDVSTIEFWVRPNWTNLSYAPVIVSAFADDAVRYAIVMTARKDAIGLYTGTDWDYVQFDFNDGRAHHVAFVNNGAESEVYIDGELAGAIAQPIQDIPARTFHIGTIDGFENQFVGTIGEVRLWDNALSPEDISEHMNHHILSAKGLEHPDLISLVGVSDFANGRRSFTLLNNDSTMVELFTQLVMRREGITPPTFDDSPLKAEDGSDLPPLPPLTAAEQAELDRQNNVRRPTISPGPAARAQ